MLEGQGLDVTWLSGHRESATAVKEGKREPFLQWHSHWEGSHVLVNNRPPKLIQATLKCAMPKTRHESRRGVESAGEKDPVG